MKNAVITIQVQTSNPESVNSSEIMDLIRKHLESRNPAPNWVLVPVVDVKWGK